MSMSKTVPVQTIHDTVDEQDETFTLVAVERVGRRDAAATATATGTIEDNDDPLSLSVANTRGRGRRFW